MITGGIRGGEAKDEGFNSSALAGSLAKGSALSHERILEEEED